MALAFVLDENQRGLIWRHIERHNSKGQYLLDVVRIGDPPDLPLGTSDPDLLLWAERQNRILVSRDRQMLGKHFTGHIKSGHRCPGIFQVRDVAFERLVEFLVCACYASDAAEWENRITYIP